MLVLNKPPGAGGASLGGARRTHAGQRAAAPLRGRLSGIGGVVRPGIVHRLDKDTSGCLLVAKNDAAHVALAEQFAGRTMEKIYHAIVCGEVANEAGEIHASVARHPSHRKRMAVTDGRGREAWTSYRVLEQLRGATLLEATLHTGRTHQIRGAFPAPRFSGGGRHGLWKAAERAAGGVDGPHGTAADVARAAAGFYPSDHGQESGVRGVVAGGFQGGAEGVAGQRGN